MKKIIKLGDIGKISMCKRVLKCQTSKKETIPFFKISTFGRKADTFISKKLFDEYKKKYSFPKKGDILISASGTIGKTVIYDGKPAYFQDSNIVWINNDETIILNNYLYYFFQTNPWKSTNGSTIKRIYNNDLRNLQIIIPNKIIQDKIASILSTIDKKIELNNQINQKLEAMAKTLYDYWFVQFDFPNSEGKPYKSFGGKMVYSEELKREIPEGWEVEKVSSCSEIVDCLHSKKPMKQYEDSNYYLLQLENIRNDGLIDLTNKYFVSKDNYKLWTSRIEIKDNDILITNAGRVASTAQIPKNIVAGIGRNITAIRPKSISPTYLYLSFKGEDMRRQIIWNTDLGSFFKSLNVKGIKQLCILRNKKIELKFEKQVLPIRRKRENLQMENQKLTQLRDWLLPMLMNGQVRVNL